MQEQEPKPLCPELTEKIIGVYWLSATGLEAGLLLNFGSAT
jgi:hypothetical protein